MSRKKQPVQEQQQDDALFEALGKSKKRKRRKVWLTVLCVLLVVVLALVIVVKVLQNRVQEQFQSAMSEVKSYTVTTGSISTVVSGSGTLSDVDLQEITVPDGVELTEILVSSGDTVSSGDVLATVDMASVIDAMADLQSELDSLDSQLSDAKAATIREKIRAGVSGRVKAVYAQEGDAVADTMYGQGALAVLSLDGYMAVELDAAGLAKGDDVTVRLSDGTEVTGTVDTVTRSGATVLIDDDGPAWGETVTVLSGDGAELGTGTLEIHSPLRITGYAGTVKTVSVDVEDKVSSTTTLFTLEDTSYPADYDSLLRSREEKEQTLLELLAIRRDGAVLSPISGSITAVGSTDSTAVASLSPDQQMSVTVAVDEGDILSLELGQTAEVTVSSVSGDAFSGTVTEINRTSAAGAYSAVVTLDKVAGMLSGMTASVSVRIEGVDDALLIPVEALHKTGAGAYVYTSYNEETQTYGGKVDVVTGLSNSNFVEITSGLSLGDTVYYTESTSFADFFGSFGNFGNGEMPDFGGGEGGGFGGGDMPGGRGTFSGFGGQG